MIQFALAILLAFGTQQDQVEITAKGPQSWEQHVYHARDNVVVLYQDIRVEADEVSYDDDTKIVTADGHIRFTRGNEHLEGDHVTYNLETHAGDFKNVKGELGPGLYITAEETHRNPDGKYDLTNANVTTCCDTVKPHWTLTLPRATVDPNKNVSAKGSVFRLHDVPVFYMPYVAVPNEDRSRSSGFLIPSTSTSTTKGRNISEAFYWAINRSADATFTGEYFSMRGPAGAAEFRARPNAGSFIRINSMFAHDKLGQGGTSARILGSGDVGRGFRGVVDMNFVSSFQFRQVYEEGLNVISLPSENSFAFATRNRPNMSVNFLYGRNGVFYRPEDPTVVLRKFPTVELAFPSRLVTNLPLYLSAETSVAGISRRDETITTPPFVQRVDVHPVLEMPIIRSSFVDWSQRVGIRETAYSHSREAQVVSADLLNRFSVEYSSSVVGPQIERDFGRWRHVIEPSADVRYVGGVDQFNNTIKVDEVDLVANTKEVEYAITNRVFTSREVFSWRLAQKYFFDPTFGGSIIPGRRNVLGPVLDISGFAFADGVRRLSPLVSIMRFSPNAATLTDIQVDYDTRDHLFRSAGIAGTARRGQFGGGISYFFTRRSAIEIPNNQVRLSLSYGSQVKPGFSAAFGFAYDVQHSLFQGSVAQVGYNRDCYGLSFELSQFNIGARVESRFRFAFMLKNIGSVGTLRAQERLF